MTPCSMTSDAGSVLMIVRAVSCGEATREHAAFLDGPKAAGVIIGRLPYSKISGFLNGFLLTISAAKHQWCGEGGTAIANESRMKLAHFVAAFVVLPLTGACQRKDPEPLVPASGSVREVETAIDRLATARCDYAQRCRRIGPEAQYSSREHCTKIMHTEAQRDLNQCRRGVDQEDLRECLTQIQNEDCSGAFRRVDEYKDCHLDDLCAD